ncbi:MAG: type II toxin-antitoxin system prevent-host-death family antitoxin [Sulfurimonas sp.]|jgi:antitoxin YefM
MQTISFSQMRQNLATAIDTVVNNHSPIIITRQNKEPVVMISLDDYKSIEETAYLMQSMANASRLNSAIAQLEAGQGTKRELIEE